MCLYVSTEYLNNLRTDFHDISGGARRGRKKNRLDFGGDQDCFVDHFPIFFSITRLDIARSVPPSGDVCLCSQ